MKPTKYRIIENDKGFYDVEQELHNGRWGWVATLASFELAQLFEAILVSSLHTSALCNTLGTTAMGASLSGMMPKGSIDDIDSGDKT